MLTLVTSLNAQLYEQYGKRFFYSFRTMAQDVRLVVVFEGPIPADIAQRTEPIELVALDSPEFSRFLQFFGNLYEANGLKILRLPQPNGQTTLHPKWDYRFNLIRFSFKIFSLDIARKLIAADDYFAWLDADVVCLKPLHAASLLSFFPESDQIASYLGRTHFPQDNPCSECGFVGFNPRHPQLSAFLERMKALYTTGEAFRFKEWHDSWLFDEVRREFQSKGFGFKNLSGKAEHLEHPFINSGLGEFFDHLKGEERKLAGRSFDHDRQIR
jgi:hypothetical protein